jgi:hypothetical protein
LFGRQSNIRRSFLTLTLRLFSHPKEQQMVTAAVILSFVISIVLVFVAISQIDA